MKPGGLVRQGRLAKLRISITDAPGILAAVSALIGENGGNIIDVYHHRMFYDIPVKLAEIDVVIETQDTFHVTCIIDKLIDAGFQTRRMGGTSLDGG